MPPRRITIPKLGLTAAAAAILVAADPARAQSPAADSLEALTVFRENIDAIHKRDHGRYLKTYLQTDQLTRGGLRGVERGWLSWTARPARRRTTRAPPLATSSPSRLRRPPMKRHRRPDAH